VAVNRAILDHPDLAIAFDDLRLDFADFSLIKSRQSFFAGDDFVAGFLNAAGQSESVWRGKPSVGLVFSQDFSSGLSDH